MNNKKLVQYLYLLFSVSFIFFLSNGCKDYKEPDIIYNPNTVDNTKNPVINSVTPSGTAIAGVREITILGDNFTTGDTTWVFVGANSSAIIKSITKTQIDLYRPTNFGNSLDIKVVVPSVDVVGKLSNYNIESPIDSLLIFRVGSGIPDFFAMDIDKNGTYWVCSPREIDTVTADGLLFGTFKDKNNGLTTAFNSFTDMKFGRGGYLYTLVGRPDIYRISTKNSSIRPQIYATLPGNTSKLDFDANGNLYTGGNTGLYVVTPNTDSTGTNPTLPAGYTGVTFIEIRVFNNYVYVADSKNLWRSSIDGNGGVGSQEQLVNLNNLSGLESYAISSFNLDSDGIVYLCLTNHPQYSLFVLESDGSVTPFYVDNIIPINVKQILWGYNSRYLYLNRSKMVSSGMRIYRVGMKKAGATNYGREF